MNANNRILSEVRIELAPKSYYYIVTIAVEWYYTVKMKPLRNFLHREHAFEFREHVRKCDAAQIEKYLNSYRKSKVVYDMELSLNDKKCRLYYLPKKDRNEILGE